MKYALLQLPSWQVRGQKMQSPRVLLVGALGAVVLGVLVHHFRSPGPGDSTVTSRVDVSNARVGWVARTDGLQRSRAHASADRQGARDTEATSMARAATRRGDSGPSDSIPAGSDPVDVQPGAASRVDAANAPAVLRQGGESDRAARHHPRSLEPGQGALPQVDQHAVIDNGEQARFSTNARVEIPEGGSLTGETGTISFQFEPGWSGDNQADASLVEIGDGRLRIRKNVGFLRIEMKDDNGDETGTGFSIADWEPGETHQVTVTWDGRVMSLYADGKLAAQQQYTKPFEATPGSPVYVGTAPQSAPVASGFITKVQLFSKALSPSDIATVSSALSRKSIE